jgi:membrane protease YdiL (CAAX protease family)
MLVEGVVYGLALQGAAWGLAKWLPVGRWFDIGLVRMPRGFAEVRSVGIAVGAGIFEELVFRGILCLGLHHLLRLLLPLPRLLAGAIAVAVSAAAFSAYHHLGPGGEPWIAATFTFRFHAGVLLGVVLLTRGLGIAAFAHGFYDVLVLLSRPYG